jgi:hypothetical protein
MRFYYCMRLDEVLVTGPNRSDAYADSFLRVISPDAPHGKCERAFHSTLKCLG